MIHPHRQPAVRNRRSGFTLLELLVVMAVIAILMAFLLPALIGAKQSANEAAVQAEIKGFGDAIALFKSTFGVEPPSQFTLYENPSDPLMPLTSVAIIKRLWPQFDFVNNSYDLDQNGTPGVAGVGVTLTGAECLVFFLGGIPTYTSPPPNTANVPVGVSGFSKNPSNPFAAQTATELRDGPFFDFKPGRLFPSPKQPLVIYPNNHFFLVYVDSLPNQTSPYVYASSYDGQGYNTSDLPIFGLAFSPPAQISATDLTNIYTQATSSAAPYNPKSYQIISPGVDMVYGAGGTFNPNATNSALSSTYDYDNLTNFNSGRLGPR